MDKFKPFYVWPNKSFPFRHYYKSNKLDIFIIENIIHNYNWLNAFKHKITDKHFFFVYCGWYHDEYFAKQYDIVFEMLKLNKKNFFFMFNGNVEKNILHKYGFQGDLINHNCWLDENIIKPISNLDKIYDAILISRKADFKRHYLANKINNLALIANGNSHGRDVSYPLPQYVYNNEKLLSTSEVCHKISQSYCGLMLSALEGACFASSEYLLCGTPVVSTKCLGGRDLWYDEYNSIICEDNEESVKSSVEFFKNNPRDADLIRKNHIDLASKQRQVFIDILQDVFNKYEIELVADKYFKENYFHKMRKSVVPNIEKILS
jgi:hypothetical protein